MFWRYGTLEVVLQAEFRAVCQMQMSMSRLIHCGLLLKLRWRVPFWCSHFYALKPGPLRLHKTKTVRKWTSTECCGIVLHSSSFIIRNQHIFQISIEWLHFVDSHRCQAWERRRSATGKLHKREIYRYYGISADHSAWKVRVHCGSCRVKSCSASSARTPFKGKMSYSTVQLPSGWISGRKNVFWKKFILYLTKIWQKKLLNGVLFATNHSLETLRSLNFSVFAVFCAVCSSKTL